MPRDLPAGNKALPMPFTKRTIVKTSSRPLKRQRLQTDDCKLPTDMLLLILDKADVKTKMACAQANASLRNLLLTASVWTDDVRLDLHDSRQLLWLEHHFRVMQSLSICMENCLVGRLNRLIRRVGAPRLQRLAVYMSPDDPEDSRMSVLELRTLPLLHLHISNRGWTPLLSTHQLPASLRSLSFESCQYADTQVYFGGSQSRPCLSLASYGQKWRFVEHLPVGLQSLRLFCTGFRLARAMQLLTRLTNLTQLDVDVGMNNLSRRQDLELVQDIPAKLSLQRVGLHVTSSPHRINVPDAGQFEVCRTLNIMWNERPWASSIEEQMKAASRPRLSSLVVHFRGIVRCPDLHGCLMLRELVLAHCSRHFASVSPEPFSVAGLEAVAATLTRLVVSTDRVLTSVHVPAGLRLQSLMLVCPGTLALHGDVSCMCIELEEALLGYGELSGDSSELVSGLGSRLSTAELEVLGSQPLRQGLRFTHAALVGEWWHGVHQKSMSSISLGSLCCRVRVWRHGHLCPARASFAQYGIIPTHEDREVWLNEHDIGGGDERPAWHCPRIPLRFSDFKW